MGKLKEAMVDFFDDGDGMMWTDGDLWSLREQKTHEGRVEVVEQHQEGRISVI